MISKNEIYQHLMHMVGGVNSAFTTIVNNHSEEELSNRKNSVGHLTASGIIFHLQSDEILLLHHKTLNKWLVPGGHIEMEDSSLAGAALREVAEETGIIADQLIPLNVIHGMQCCIGIDSHIIPANKSKQEGEHYHHDFRFAFGYNGHKELIIDRNESVGYKWVSINDPYLSEIIDVRLLRIADLSYRIEKRQNESIGDLRSDYNALRNDSSVMSRLYVEFGRRDKAAALYENLIETGMQTIIKGTMILPNYILEDMLELSELICDYRLAEKIYINIKTVCDRYFTIGQEANKLLNALYLKTKRCEKVEADFKSCLEQCQGDSSRIIDLMYLYKQLYFENNFIEQSEEMFLSLINLGETHLKKDRQFIDKLLKYINELIEQTKKDDLKEQQYLKAIALCTKYDSCNVKKITELRSRLVSLYIEKRQLDKIEPHTNFIMKSFKKIATQCEREYCDQLYDQMEKINNDFSASQSFDECRDWNSKSTIIFERYGAYHYALKTYCASSDCRCWDRPADEKRFYGLFNKARKQYPGDESIIDCLSFYLSYLLFYAITNIQLEEAKKIYIKIREAKKIYGEKIELTSILEQEAAISILDGLLEINNFDESDTPTPEHLGILIRVIDFFGSHRNHSLIKSYQLKLASHYRSCGEFDRAEQVYLELIKAFKMTYNYEYDTPPEVLYAQWDLAQIYDQQGKTEQSMEIINNAIYYCKSILRNDFQNLKLTNLLSQMIDHLDHLIKKSN